MFLYKLNKIKVIATIAVALGCFTSCESFLTEIPESETATKSFYKDNSQLNSGLIAAYSRMSVAYASNHNTWGEFRSDNLTAEFGTNETRIQLHNHQIDETEGVLRWQNIYRAIDFTNRVINEGQKIEAFDENIVGQALALRAKAYFDIARVWGDIPAFTVSPEGVGDVFKERTSANSIMQDIVVPDMLKAAEFITVDSKEFAFTRSSVFALQGEVYLWLNENALAKTALDNLVALGTHSLVTSPEAWQDLFLNHSVTRGQTISEKRQIGSELIFSFPFILGTDSPSSGVAANYSFGSDASSSTITKNAEDSWKNRFPVVDSLWNMKYPNTQPVFSTTVKSSQDTDSIVPLYGDWRLFATRQGGSFEEGLGNEDSGEARVHKWQKTRNGLRRGDDDTNLVIYRYADVLLMLAEAELKLGNPDRSLELINQIRTARRLPLATVEQFNNDAATPLDFLLDERRFELFGEGKRWWDLLRNNKALEAINPILIERGVPELTADRLVWPIFRDHLIENPNIQQNNGWR